MLLKFLQSLTLFYFFAATYAVQDAEDVNEHHAHSISLTSGALNLGASFLLHDPNYSQQI